MISAIFLKEVEVTGLSRFDTLLNPDVPTKKKKNQLLIIPTWRNWLNEKETFVKSEYYSRYLALLQSEELRTFSKKYSMEFCFVCTQICNTILTYLNKTESPSFIKEIEMYKF